MHVLTEEPAGVVQVDSLSQEFFHEGGLNQVLAGISSPYPWSSHGVRNGRHQDSSICPMTELALGNPYKAHHISAFKCWFG